MSEIELKTCPFCGGKTYSQKLPFQPDTKYFRCGREAPDRSIIDGTGCGAIISFVGEQGNVPTEKFNTRTATARIAELEAERDKANEDASFAAKIYVKQLDIISELRAERDALRGVLEEISHDEGRFGLSASDMRELAKQVLARTELAKVK